MTNIYPYESPVPAREVNMDAKALVKVAALFEEQYRQGKFPGGQMVVRRHGQVVLNLACGMARGWQGRGGEQEVTVSAQTPFAVFSTGKPMAALVIALLESRGQLDIHAEVADILPEFTGMGREAITILDVLTHRGGILLPNLIDDPERNGDAEALWQLLVQTPPRYPLGTFAYMPLEYGIILDRLVQQITTKPLATVFDDEFAHPLGLPQMHYGLGTHQLGDIAWNYWLGGERCVVAEMDIAPNFEQHNNIPAVFSARNPAFGMVSDAANLAAFYEFLVHDGRNRNDQQLLPTKLVRRYTRRQTSGWNKSINTYLSLGYGFILGTVSPSFYGWWGSSGCFGHAGIFSSLAFADHKTGVAVAIVTNGNKGLGDFLMRFAPLAHGVRRACR